MYIHLISFHFRKLPASFDQTNVTLHDGLIVTTIDDRMRMTYDPISKVYVMETSMSTHNHSIGLLGTNTRDKGDEMTLPSGKIADNLENFVHKVHRFLLFH